MAVSVSLHSAAGRKRSSKGYVLQVSLQSLSSMHSADGEIVFESQHINSDYEYQPQLSEIGANGSCSSVTATLTVITAICPIYLPMADICCIQPIGTGSVTTIFTRQICRNVDMSDASMRSSAAKISAGPLLRRTESTSFLLSTSNYPSCGKSTLTEHTHTASPTIPCLPTRCTGNGPRIRISYRSDMEEVFFGQMEARSSRRPGYCLLGLRFHVSLVSAND